MITIKQILDSKKKEYNIIKPTDLVIDALTMLNSVNLSYLIVMDGDRFLGIFCERDYCRNVVLKGRSSATATVQDVMTTDLPLAEVTDTAEQCMNLLLLHKSRYVPVFDDGEFAGVITIHDLLRSVLSNREDVFDFTFAHRLIDQQEGEKIF